MLNYEVRIDEMLIWDRDFLTFPPHFHDSIEIEFINSGSTTFIQDSHEYILNAGDCCISMPNQPHSFRDNGAVHAHVFIFPRSSAHAYPEIISSTPECPVIRDALDDPTIKALYNEIRFYHYFKGPFHEQIIDGAFTAMLGEFFTRMKFTRTQKNAVTNEQRIISYCSEHYKEPISLDSVAKHTNVSKYHISHIFSQKLLMKFPVFINSLRIEEACRRIKNGESITESALNSGFSSIRSFNRAFYSIRGMTPSEFIKETKKVKERDKEIALQREKLMKKQKSSQD